MIMTIGKIVRNGQITVPVQLRKRLHIKDGDFVRFDTEDNHLIVTPVSVIDQDQSYFHSEKWQKGIKASEEAVRQGKYSTYASAKSLRKDIEDD